MAVWGVIMPGGSWVSGIVFFDHGTYLVLWGFLSYPKFLLPCYQLLQNFEIILPIVLLLQLIFPPHLELEFPSEPSGIDKFVNYP